MITETESTASTGDELIVLATAVVIEAITATAKFALIVDIESAAIN